MSQMQVWSNVQHFIYFLGILLWQDVGLHISLNAL